MVKSCLALKGTQKLVGCGYSLTWNFPHFKCWFELWGNDTNAQLQDDELKLILGLSNLLYKLNDWNYSEIRNYYVILNQDKLLRRISRRPETRHKKRLQYQNAISKYSKNSIEKIFDVMHQCKHQCHASMQTSKSWIDANLRCMT